MKDCTCEGWKTSMPQIESAQILANARGIEYTGLVFNFCPWCGKEGEEESDEEIRERVLKFFPQPEDIIKVTIPQIMSDKFSGVAYNIYTDKAKPQSARIKVKYPNLDEIWQEIMNYVPVTWEIIVEEF